MDKKYYIYIYIYIYIIEMSRKRDRGESEEPYEGQEDLWEKMSAATDYNSDEDIDSKYDQTKTNVENVLHAFDPRHVIHAELPQLNAEQKQEFNLLSWRDAKDMVTHPGHNTLAQKLNDLIEEKRENVGRYTRALKADIKREEEYKALFPKTKRVRSGSFGEGGKRRKTKKSRTKKSRTRTKKSRTRIRKSRKTRRR